MSRLEKVREYVNDVLRRVPDPDFRVCGYSHLYGVSLMCVLIANKRGENVELLAIAGMLHDIYTFSAMDSKGHARKGAVMAREILTSMGIFSEDEIEMICGAIHNHGDKGGKHSPFDEVLIDADVLHHCFYDPEAGVFDREKERFEALKKEFGLI
ncbi:MAG: HD domain-containing protein [Clostridiaceae bacterium]|nr:HD domain-containing protein [Clostridiaceae bacterium]